MKNLFFAAAMIPMIYGAAQDSDDQIRDLQAQIQEIRVMAESKQIGAKSPAGYPKIEDAVGLRFEIGGLYQNAVLGGTEYAYIAITDDPDSDLGNYHAEMFQPEAKMSWGVNGAISYYCQQYGYELKLRNSYYDLSTESHIERTSGNYIYPLNYLNDELIEVYAQTGSSNLNVTYDLLGLELQKSFYVNRYFSIDAIGGVLASWTWFTHDIQFEELFFEGEYADSDWFLNRHDHSSWFGVGPELGLNLNFMLGEGFSIFFNNTGALMYGNFDVEFRQDSFFLNGEQEVAPQTRVKASDHRIMPYVQSFMGLAYEFYAGKDKNFLKIRAGYNTQYFINANTMIRYDGDDVSHVYYRLSENLQTQGLLFDLAWSF